MYLEEVRDSHTRSPCLLPHVKALVKSNCRLHSIPEPELHPAAEIQAIHNRSEAGGRVRTLGS